MDSENIKDIYSSLFSDSDLQHMRKYREYLYIWRGKGGQRIVSNIYLGLVAVFGMVANALWLAIPIIYGWMVFYCGILTGIPWWVHIVILIAAGAILGVVMSPNFTSPHLFYKRRLKKAYLIYGQKLKLWELNHAQAPYPLINANVSVNYDKYDTASAISYRGPIKSNYFLFSPLFCGSQVTNYTPSRKKTYADMTLATAMATSAAAVNTFMGNFKLPFIVRQIMALLNLRTGILAPNPQLNKKQFAFWPRYTFLEVMGNSDTTTHYIQVSDGGHVENLAIYELLRRKVKVIIAIDAGEDRGFEFEDLRNLVVRARSEQGIIIDFHPNARPQDVIKPDVSNGFSNRYFVVAKIRTMKGAYHKNYDGILIYIKSAMLASKDFTFRNIKNQVKRLAGEGKLQEAAAAKRVLDSRAYRTYNPKFPHEPTSDQFFDEAQWNAYHDLGQEIGIDVCEKLNLKYEDNGESIFKKANDLYSSYNRQPNEDM